MRHVRRSAALLIALAVAAGLAAPRQAPAAEFVIKLGHVLPTNEPIHQAFERLGQRVKEKSKGRVEIQVFPASQIGSNRDTYEQARMGAPVMVHIDPGYAAELGDLDIGILNGPFLFDGWDQAKKVLAAPLVQAMNENLRKKGGIRILSWGYYFGQRHIISDRGYPTPADIKGKKVRVPPNVMWVETFKAMGAVPTPLQWAEVYQGLAQGVVDAAEAPLSTLIGSKLHEVKKTITLTGHFKAVTGVAIGEQYFQSLPKDVQQLLAEEAEEGGRWVAPVVVKKEDEFKQDLQKAGVTFVAANAEAYRKATLATYNAFPKWSPGLYDKVRAAMK
ncbi:MAG: C4-dicarboxylate TRAP transporter substrate-binding protein [Candidatus Methylomirabilales bacterium]